MAGLRCGAALIWHLSKYEYPIELVEYLRDELVGIVVQRITLIYLDLA